MAQINVILWDVDGTLLDFSAAERRALEDCFRSFQMGPCTPELLARYSQINRTYWRRLERGELTKPQVLLGRFEEFFAQEGLNCRDIPAFNQEYQLRLGDTVVFRDDAGSLVARLKGRVRQYAVTNGTGSPRSGSCPAPAWTGCWTGSSSLRSWGPRSRGPPFLTRYSPRSAPAAGTR